MASHEPSYGITEDRRARLRSKGLLLIRSAVKPPAVARLAAAIDRLYDEELVAGRVKQGERMHMLGGVARSDAFLELLDNAAVFPHICRELGWNIYVYHSHVDLTPPVAGESSRPVWGWHQDGGRQNLDLEGEPRPRLSLKVGFWLSDVSVPGRGNMLVIPGSHTRNSLPRPSAREGSVEQPTGCEPVLARPGDALIFDRRLWHSRSENRSAHTRKAVFLSYTYRWIRPRDWIGIDRSSARFRGLSALRGQLLGLDSEPHSHWGLRSDDVPLRGALERRGALDPSTPNHR